MTIINLAIMGDGWQINLYGGTGMIILCWTVAGRVLTGECAAKDAVASQAEYLP